MTSSPAPPLWKPPNLLIGFLLNLAFPCSGFTYIGEPWKALGWTAFWVVIFPLIGLINLSSQDGAPGLLVLKTLPLFWLSMQVQLVVVHQRSFAHGQPATVLANKVKWNWIGIQAAPCLMLYLFLWGLSGYHGG
ncbi:hypothetical protein [Deinococcus sp.]|uniref:hypothetical protein n=1 Tax=Deinococcus sp. TaxID=47478 RepID=UPI003CC63816